MSCRRSGQEARAERRPMESLSQTGLPHHAAPLMTGGPLLSNLRAQRLHFLASSFP
jgi:hypothetical protein